MSHTSSRATSEFHLSLIVLVVMFAIVAFVAIRVADTVGKAGCIASPGAQVCGTQVTRP